MRGDQQRRHRTDRRRQAGRTTKARRQTGRHARAHGRKRADRRTRTDGGPKTDRRGPTDGRKPGDGRKAKRTDRQRTDERTQRTDGRQRTKDGRARRRQNARAHTQTRNKGTVKNKTHTFLKVAFCARNNCQHGKDGLRSSNWPAFFDAEGNCARTRLPPTRPRLLGRTSSLKLQPPQGGSSGGKGDFLNPMVWWIFCSLVFLLSTQL